MSMLNYPFLHFNGKPEGVDTKGDEGEEVPKNELAEELTALTVENKLTAVNGSVLCYPGLVETDRPRSCKTTGDSDDEVLQNVDTDKAKKASRELRFHKMNPPRCFLHRYA